MGQTTKLSGRLFKGGHNLRSKFLETILEIVADGDDRMIVWPRGCFGPYAARLAYAIGTDRWKNGEIDGEQQEFLDAIRYTIRGAPYDCPRCDRMTAKD